MNPIVSIGVSVFTLVLGWVLNEISHRWRSRDEGRQEKERQHRAAQTAALIDLQRVAREYYEIAGRSLWVAWSCTETPNDEDYEAEANELHDDLESQTMELFATRARVDDLRIRSFVDYLEEMARQFIAASGESFAPNAGLPRRGEAVLLEQDSRLQGILLQLNNHIGSRLLELVGVTDPDTPPYGGE
jgi:hypothetical protein